MSEKPKYQTALRYVKCDILFECRSKTSVLFKEMFYFCFHLKLWYRKMFLREVVVGGGGGGVGGAKGRND